MNNKKKPLKNTHNECLIPHTSAQCILIIKQIKTSFFVIFFVYETSSYKTM